MQVHYLSWSSQNELLKACTKQVLDKNVKKAVDAILDVFHTDQISFILRYVHENGENVWDIKSIFYCLKTMGKREKT